MSVGVGALPEAWKTGCGLEMCPARAWVSGPQPLADAGPTSGPRPAHDQWPLAHACRLPCRVP